MRAWMVTLVAFLHGCTVAAFLKTPKSLLRSMDCQRTTVSFQRHVSSIFVAQRNGLGVRAGEIAGGIAGITPKSSSQEDWEAFVLEIQKDIIEKAEEADGKVCAFVVFGAGSGVSFAPVCPTCIHLIPILLDSLCTITFQWI